MTKQVAHEPAVGGPAPNRTVIVGGGVAGLEALLALRALLGEQANVLLISPQREFVYRALGVAEPFGRVSPGPWDLAELVASAGGAFSQGALASVSGTAKHVVTESGNVFRYDNLLLAPGVRPRQVLPGAIDYRGPVDNPRVTGLLNDLDAGTVESIAYAVPTAVRWALPLYELALQTAVFVAEHRLDADLTLVTHEPRPLGAFGHEASASVERLLVERGVSFHPNAASATVRGGELVLMNGHRIAADRVVTLPAPQVDPIPGVPQGPHGLIGTDPFMRVESMTDVYAAGDATWFPIKQGGLAAQQADTAARSIASRIDRRIEPAPFVPVLRGALLTGGVPQYLRAETSRPEVSRTGRAPLWSPPSKIAGRYLTPFLAARSGRAPRSARRNQPLPPLGDLADLQSEDLERSEDEHAEAVELALSSAEAEARWGDYRAAGRWLDVAEALDLTLAPEYARKRSEWAANDRKRRGLV
jgi:sulfide:quinone oxidoreductase